MRVESPLPGTVEARQPQKSHYEAIVVGGGVAGATTAACLSLQGIETVMLDPQIFPRDKIGGDAVNAKALIWWSENAQFEWKKAGLRPQVIDQFRIVAPNGKELVLPLLEREGYPFITSRRMDLDNAIHQHALANNAEYRQVRVKDLIYEEDKNGLKRLIGIRGEENERDIELTGDFIIGADGSSSIVARKLQFPVEQKASAIRAYVELKKPVPNELALLYLKDILPAYAWFFTMSRENGKQIGNIGLGFLNNNQLRAFDPGSTAKQRR